MNRIVALCFLLTSCSAFEGKQKTNVNEIIKTQEIRQLNHAEIIIAAEQYGAQTYAQIDEAYRSGQIDCADAVAHADQTIARLATEMEGQIVLGFEQGDFTSKQEKDLLEAYQYNQENAVQSQPSIQMMDDKYALYTVPFAREDSVYSHCVPDTVVGMWSLVLPIKTVINHLD
ncbi:hypothetical protein BFP72_16265 [Reichenbachiella sp. 5M10]|uniref:hypothetical protein n=1 Tax=Reichenbachiella sp. 5M10 TaxID=1889772 RepID=UPI000C1522D7|nr:hypothetical protein [Reichenbachiella sp. 5M10]PIB36841.1 hypothetical protein BFP72_16265 [Reichenbachiella sp. 5M10]